MPTNRKPYEDVLFGFTPGGSVYVKATDWQQFLNDHSDIYVHYGRVYRMKGEDAAGGMVRVTLVLD